MNENEFTKEQIEKVDFSPVTNPNVIALVKDTDGNWRGFMQKNGKLIQGRQYGPDIVLTLLITNDGKQL